MTRDEALNLILSFQHTVIQCERNPDHYNRQDVRDERDKLIDLLTASPQQPGERRE